MTDIIESDDASRGEDASSDYSVLSVQSCLMEFRKDGHLGRFDIVDGKFDYQGDLPITDAAHALFTALASVIDHEWMERARTKSPAIRAADTGLREFRVPIMMSEQEITAIDDWRFANRVATRSGAVRQLVTAGLTAKADKQRAQP